MLNHREKRRYVAIMYDENLYQPLQINEKIVDRFKELFGIFQSELAMLKLYDSEFENIMIVGCKLKYLDYFLVSSTLTQPAVTVVSLSGTLKRLRKNVSKFAVRNIKNNPS